MYGKEKGGQRSSFEGILEDLRSDPEKDGAGSIRECKVSTEGTVGLTWKDIWGDLCGTQRHGIRKARRKAFKRIFPGRQPARKD